MKELTRLEVEAMIENIVDHNIKLEDLYYYEFENDVFYSICYSPFQLKTNEVAISGGKPIVIKYLSKKQLFPPILEILNYPIIYVSSIQAINISKGKTINYSHNEGIYKINDKLDRTIGLGKINNNILIPLVDIGYFLRYEDIQ